ncbi:VWA domain-containing protein [Cellulomonas sp. KRMCY2]|uniref:VWA domain-containing protein n=1 Tax=Cellulomonas sp. KRMCY2 TaxID=1304865 RepID=UPI0012DF1F26|nr:VWA domain-containing protein [Cellulomonas sp. KRMCY2]
MSLVWPWLLGGCLVVVAGVAAVAWRRRGEPSGDARWVAHTEYLEQLPQVQRAMRRYQLVRVAGVVALVLAVVGAGVLAARPVQREVVTERLGTRDIVLCLDVSGSMVPFDSAITATFADLVDSFSGERIALSVFNSTSRTVFPLTDDYTLVLEELETARRALSFDIEGFDPEDPLTWDGLEEILGFISGTEGVVGESSLIGDGLATCALLFDEQATDRSRSIILATDNDVLGEPIYTLPQAVDLVSGRDVQLYGLYGGDESLRGSAQNLEFTTAVEESGGMTWFAEDPTAVRSVIDDVTAQQAVALDDDPQVLLIDRPGPWFALLVIGLVGLVALRWRARE